MRVRSRLVKSSLAKATGAGASWATFTSGSAGRPGGSAPDVFDIDENMLRDNMPDAPFSDLHAQDDDRDPTRKIGLDGVGWEIGGRQMRIFWDEESDKKVKGMKMATPGVLPCDDPDSEAGQRASAADVEARRQEVFRQKKEESARAEAGMTHTSGSSQTGGEAIKAAPFKATAANPKKEDRLFDAYDVPIETPKPAAKAPEYTPPPKNAPRQKISLSETRLAKDAKAAAVKATDEDKAAASEFYQTIPKHVAKEEIWDRITRDGDAHYAEKQQKLKDTEADKKRAEGLRKEAMANPIRAKVPPNPVPAGNSADDDVAVDVGPDTEGVGSAAAAILAAQQSAKARGDEDVTTKTAEEMLKENAEKLTPDVITKARNIVFDSFRSGDLDLSGKFDSKDPKLKEKVDTFESKQRKGLSKDADVDKTSERGAAAILKAGLAAVSEKKPDISQSKSASAQAAVGGKMNLNSPLYGSSPTPRAPSLSSQQSLRDDRDKTAAKDPRVQKQFPNATPESLRKAADSSQLPKGPQPLDYMHIEENLKENAKFHYELGEDYIVDKQRRNDWYAVHALALALNKARWVHIDVQQQRGQSTKGSAMRTVFWKESVHKIINTGDMVSGQFVDAHPVLRPFAASIRNRKPTKAFMRSWVDARLKVMNQPGNMQQLTEHFDKYYGNFYNTQLEVLGCKDDNAEHMMKHIARAVGIVQSVMLWRKYAQMGQCLLPADLCANNHVNMSFLQSVHLASKDEHVRKLLFDCCQVAFEEMTHATVISREVPPEAMPVVADCFYANYYLQFLQRYEYDVTKFFTDADIEGPGFQWFVKKKLQQWNNNHSMEELVDSAAPLPYINVSWHYKGIQYKDQKVVKSQINAVETLQQSQSSTEPKKAAATA